MYVGAFALNKDIQCIMRFGLVCFGVCFFIYLYFLMAYKPLSLFITKAILGEEQWRYL